VHPRWVLVLSGLTALLLLGCHGSLDRSRGGVDVVVEDGEHLPDGIAGRWQADRDRWEFVFAPDGRILSAVIGLGRVRVVAGRVTTVPTWSGNKAVFAPGRWTVHYAPDTRQLTLRIVMDHVCVRMAGDTLEGSSTDVFTGPIDLTKGLWQADHTTFTRYTAYTADKPPADLSTDPTYGETMPVTFRKTSDP
jgi:hypothetical protein